jgi:hypothetical protein
MITYSTYLMKKLRNGSVARSIKPTHPFPAITRNTRYGTVGKIGCAA